MPDSEPTVTPPAHPLVSVITIFRDAERFLDEAVESMFAQTYPNWELLLVDDGSTDGSTGAARRWAASHPDRIRYLEHDGHVNLGMSASRNHGVRHARGEYLAFLDSDDVYLPRKLERQVALLAEYPEAGMIYGASQYWYGWTGDPADVARDRIRRQGVPGGTLLQPKSLLVPLMKEEARPPCPCGVLVRRDAFEAAGGFEERFRGMYEDQVFFFKIFARVPVLVDAECHERYRQHADSHCSTEGAKGTWSRTGRPSPAQAMFLDWLERFITSTGLSEDPLLRKALRRALRPYRSRAFYFAHLLAISARQSRIFTFAQRVARSARNTTRAIAARIPITR
jgi:glycosyltransferase involved in cell wall biosynthesis